MPEKIRVLRFLFAIIIFLFTLSVIGVSLDRTNWGFFGHRKINRMAVFTLPPEMLGFYKTNIEYITEHAVDPDKRRYALKNEFARHYIDIDHWDTIPFNHVPREMPEAVMKFGKLLAINADDKDTIDITDSIKDTMAFYFDHIYLDRYSPEIVFDAEMTDLIKYNNKESHAQVLFKNELIAYGALPYFLEDFFYTLQRSFESRDAKAILKVSADIGHYIADAHVPLHTTVNYNGQLTNQLGIHAFWESRLPELFADELYDYMVGKAEYIENLREYIWTVVTESHRLLPEVLAIEKRLSQQFPDDQQYCFDERLERTIRTQCPEYAAAYHLAMDGMVEKRMQDAIHAVASFWYTAWIEAGQPDLDNFDKPELTEEEKAELKKLENLFQNYEIKGREHTN